MRVLKSAVAILLSTYLLLTFAQTTPTIAAAADLKFALEQIAGNYKADTGKEVKLVFGSSGVLAQQTKNGAPFGLLMSADESFVNELNKAGVTVDDGKLYAIGRIVLLEKKDSPIKLSADKEGLIKAIKEAKKIAIANPEHAPYGNAAKQYLMNIGVWDLAEPKLVYGENISQATTYALSGAADFAISALSLASSPKIKEQSTYVLIPDSLHKPLKQKMVLIKNSSPSAKDFYTYLQEPKSKQVMTSYGFILP